MAVGTKAPDIEALERVPQTDVPEKLRPIIFPFNRADWLSLVGFFGILLIVNPLYGKVASLGVIAAWLAWMWPRSYGRNYELLVQKFVDLWIRWAKRGKVLDTDSQSSLLGRIWDQRPPIPLGIQAIGDIGVLHNSRDGTDSIVVVGTGSGIASLPIMVQYQLLERLADGIRKLSSLERGSVGVSFVFRRRPPDVERLRTIYQGILHPQVRDAQDNGQRNGNRSDIDTRNLRLKAIADESLDRARQFAGEVTMAVVLTVPQQEPLRKVRHSRTRGKQKVLLPAEVRRLVINKLGRIAIEVLASCDVEDPEVLDPRGAHKFLHDVWEADIDESNLYRQWLYAEPIEEIIQSDRHSPRWLEARKEFCTTNSTHHAVVRITGSPEKESDDFFPQLFAADVPWLTVTLLGKVVGSNREYAVLTRRIRLREAAREEILGINREDIKARKKAEDLVKRQELIFQSRVSQHYNLLVVVSNTDLQGLQDDVEEVLRVARTMGLEAEQVRNESRQIPAHWSAATGVDLL